MRLISLTLLALIFIHALVSAVPTNPMEENRVVEGKRRRIIASAQRLLEELTTASFHNRWKDNGNTAYLVVFEDWKEQGPAIERVYLENSQQLINYLERKQKAEESLLQPNRTPALQDHVRH